MLDKVVLRPFTGVLRKTSDFLTNKIHRSQEIKILVGIVYSSYGLNPRITRMQRMHSWLASDTDDLRLNTRFGTSASLLSV